MHRIVTILSVLGVLICTNRSSNAQFIAGPNPSVSTNGGSQVTLAPERLRVRFLVVGQGDSITNALKALRKQRDKAQGLLEELDVEEGSIRTRPPRIDRQESARAMQIQQMLGRQMPAAFGAAAAVELVPDFGDAADDADDDDGQGQQKKTSVTVNSEVTADWKLQTQAVEELLILTHELRKKLTKADITGYTALRKIDPAKQKKLQQMGMDPFGMFGTNNDPSQIILFFVATIPEAQREVALKRAFQKAKAQAEQLARVSGHQLGSLISVTNAWGGGLGYNDYEYDPFMGNDPTAQYLQQTRSRDQLGTSREVTGARPGPLKFTLSVQTSFRLVAGGDDAGDS